MKTLKLIHGRSWKPPEAELKKLWLEAVKHGIERDAPEMVQAYKDAKKEFVYFGKHSNEFLAGHENENYKDDTESRKETLRLLKEWGTRDFSKRNYNRLPGKESFKEGAADVLSPLLSFFRLSDDLISLFAPDIKEYWKGYDSDFGSKVREELTNKLSKTLEKDHSVCLMAHSLGSMIAYDVLWKFSYMSEYRPVVCDKKVDLLITMGSPLGDATVQRGLFGSQASGNRKYPKNIRKWINIAAEDDYISHDERIRNDYQYMTRNNMVDSIEDRKIYNLSLRKGKSNPHHSGGYLIHPKTISAIVEWLKE